MMQPLAELIARLPALEACQGQVQDGFELLARSFEKDGKALLAGNGGSCADADHWSGELLKQFVLPRPLVQEHQAKLPGDLAAKLQWGLPVIPLGSFPGLLSAFGNDVDGTYGYAQLTWVLGRPGDVFIGLSTSGNARNVCLAAQAARARGMTVLAMTGRSGGKLKDLADVTIHAPADRVFQIQEYHLPIYHCLSMMLEVHFDDPGRRPF